MSTVVETRPLSPSKVHPTPPLTPPLKMDKQLKEEVPIDMDIPDNYVAWTIKNQKPLPPVTWSSLYKELNYLSLYVLTITPAIAIWGAFHVKLRWETALWSVIYYFITGLGITAGYHRLWAHRSYNASRPLQYALAMAGSGAVEGSIKWWCRGHRAHHRYTDTELDPYNAHRGFWWSHIGWMLIKPRRKPGVADVSDLSKNEIVRWQHRWYVQLIIGMGFLVPTFVAGLGWGDWAGGFFYAGAARLCFVHHSTFCVNSLAHWLGDTPFDDKHTPRDHVITALATIGEGYHNFHHQFPMDYRNAIRWYQYDPTKWFIWVCQKLGLASHLKVFPDNEVKKGQLTMQLKRLRETQEGLVFAPDVNELPIISWESFQEQSGKRALVVIGGFIHDVSSFVEEHPGGRHLIAKNIGKDATTAFFGGVYDHSNAAHNWLSMMRVGVLIGGTQHGLDDKNIPPSQRLRIARYNELGSGNASSTAVEDSEGLLG
ncbi:delta 9-fatty acid desaturase protein [Laetiporus sulphureus 93-53]|uniref:Acyl-CoA desaturase n=1 Tax=Laetiporus sulphureus 93-53 TaxID=1314785 RepID=A0A165GI08_9APHY|nr:delta 9-fatty acid desaturase protein [Laetiporus sulphureus 93-53]KZT10376.1 delta 9-fatty acid desaturase protein [Laetiporus sulphureus 93-53]